MKWSKVDSETKTWMTESIGYKSCSAMCKLLGVVFFYYYWFVIADNSTYVTVAVTAAE